MRLVRALERHVDAVSVSCGELAERTRSAARPPCSRSRDLASRAAAASAACQRLRRARARRRCSRPSGRRATGSSAAGSCGRSRCSGRCRSRCATPGPTMPTHVLPISCWMSPWFQAKPEVDARPAAARARGVRGLEEEVGIAEIDERRRPVGSVLTMCSACSSDRVGERVGQRHRLRHAVRPDVRVGQRSGRRRHARACAPRRRSVAGLAVDVERRRVVEVDVELSAVGLVGDQALDVRVDLADLVRRARSEIRAAASGCRSASSGRTAACRRPPAKWSPSSTVITKSVLPLLIPCCCEVLEEVLEGLS